MAARYRNISLQADFMGTVGKILVDEHYPTEIDEPPLFDKIESIRSNVKFEQCYERSKLIGDGKFGKVYLVRERATGTEFAAKVIRLKQQADRQEVEREVSILTQLRHPRIAQIYDAFYTANNEVVLVMEIVRGGELFDRVADENYVLTEQAVVMIICQLCEAIDYIHEQNILHLDIKPENIMCVSQTGNRIKLIDFGLARYYDGTQELRYMAGTPEFAAPEVIKYEQLDFSTDMWSVGVITYILLSGYSPFLGENICETYCNVEKGAWEFTEEFDSVSEEAKDFVSRLIVYDKRKRMLPKECLAHPWIAKHRAKASSDTILEGPAEGPIMDKKQMMRYNAKRKFRLFYGYMRVITYVKVLIELNRLRRTAMTCRMSQSGQKYFETLLLVAEQEKQMVQQGISKENLSEMLLPMSPEENVSDDKPSKIGEASTSGVDSEGKETLSTGSRTPSELSSPEETSKNIKAAPAAATRTDLIETETLEQPSNKRKSANKTDHKDPSALKPPLPTSQPKVKVPSPSNDNKELKKVEHEKKPSLEKRISIPEVIVTVPPEKATAKPLKTKDTENKTEKKSPSSTLKEASVTENATRRTEVKKPPALILRKSASLERATLAQEQTERRSLREKKPPSLESLPVTQPKSPVSAPIEPLKFIKKPRDISSRESSSERKKNVDVKSEDTRIQTSGEVLVIRDGSLKKVGSGKNICEATTEKSLEKTVKEAAKTEKEGGESLRVRKSSAPEAIITVPPKKTVLGTPQATATDENRTTPMRMNRFRSSESGDSTKENRSTEEKAPTRQGALRKKEKPAENPLIDSMFPAPQQTTLGPTLSRKKTSTAEPKPPPLSTEVTPPAVKQSSKDATEKKAVSPTPHKRGGLVQEKLSKLLNATNAAAKEEKVKVFPKSPLKDVHSLKREQDTIQEQKKAKLLPITTESKTTTTFLTSTSTKTRIANTEKKIQLISQGKNIEEVERTSTEQDNTNVRKITLKKAESQDVPGLTTTMKKNVVKQDSLRSTAEKERVEEECKESAKTVKTARSAVSKLVDKVTVEESSKMNGKTTKLSISGTKDVTRKVNEKAEVDIAAEGKTQKKSEVTAKEKVKMSIDVEKDSNKGSIGKTTVQKVVINPASSPSSSKEDLKGNVSVRMRKPSPESKLPAHDPSKMKENAAEVKKNSDTKLPTLSKNAPNDVPAMITKTTSVKMREGSKDGDETEIKKKRATIAFSSDFDKKSGFVPRDDFSFDALKEKLIRRVSTDHTKPKPKKECIPITSLSSVRDRLKQFESKK
ncbi:hypothetical protein RB195_025794 [Necator americanus]|uniref:Protein kinase domain-containing protein n=1 Tax=Necator americanus TaxID=51031 RepID=A0ABR1ETX7_NECAM